MKKMALLLLSFACSSVFTVPATASENTDSLQRPSSPPGPGWALDRINQGPLPLDGTATRYLDASGVTAYIVDNGIYQNTDEFGTRMRNGFTVYHRADGTPAYADDDTTVEDNWHGTQAASLIGGRTYGIARNVNLVNVKVTRPGLALTKFLIDGLDFILHDPLVPDNHLKVVNISLLYPINTTLDAKVIELINAGITVVVGAGNGVDQYTATAHSISACDAGSPAHLGLPSSPGSPSTITVSATTLSGNTQDARVERPGEWFANDGPCVDIFAPGDEVDTFRGKFRGTSAAAPYVTGLVAHLLAANAGNPYPRTPAQIEDLVKTLATHNVVANANVPSPSHLLRLPGVAGDLDNDGHADLIWHNQITGTVAAWLMDGTAYQTVIDLPGISNTAYRIGGTADFDRDGDTDILWTNASTGANAIWRMQGLTLQEVVNLPNLPVGFHLSGTGDFNGDGDPDILLRNESWPFTALWLLHGMTYDSTVNLPALPGNFQLSGAGDFDGDGHPDILWRNTSNGANAVWLMDGTTISSILNLPGLANPDYHIVAVADYNGDGKPDLVWRNLTTGADAIWIMNGGTLSQVVNLPTLVRSDWDIEAPK